MDIQLLIEEHDSRGSWNMAADEFLLLRALDTGQPAVRIYSWDTPTVSLGYFQNAEDFHRSGRFRGLPAVRRLSGGGAILHDQEITYSFAVPAGFTAAPDFARLYEAAHSGIRHVLQNYGVAVLPRGMTRTAPREPFLCFSRGDRNDLILQGVKVAGSAQRRRRGAVLQHGSVLLDAARQAPELPGIRNLVPSFAPDGRIRNQLGTSIVSELLALRSPAVRRDLHAVNPATCFSAAESEQIQSLEHTRYRELDQIRSQTMVERDS